MGYEYQVHFPTRLAPVQLKRLLLYLEQPHSWCVVHQEPQGEGARLRYAYRLRRPPDWDEDFLLDVSAQEIYLLLHAATHLSAVWTWLQQGLAAQGIAATLSDL